MRQLNANPMQGSRRGKSAASSDNAGFGDHRAAHVAQMRAMIAAQPLGDLTQGERDGLLLMREEEKIARDVYMRLHKRWGLRPFANISGSEQAHMDMMLALLEHFALPDPVQTLEAGQFHDAALQKLHDGLVEQGMKSIEDAVRVGLLIEELDIADLQKAKRKTKKLKSWRFMRSWSAARGIICALFIAGRSIWASPIRPRTSPRPNWNASRYLHMSLVRNRHERVATAGSGYHQCGDVKTICQPYCVIEFLPDSRLVCQKLGISLLTARFGSQGRFAKQRITFSAYVEAMPVALGHAAQSASC